MDIGRCRKRGSADTFGSIYRRDAYVGIGKYQNRRAEVALGKAFTYLREQWPYLRGYLKDGRLELSNNRAERSIKPFVIDRKNLLFANIPSGSRSSAVIFSLIQTATENDLDPYRYPAWLLASAAQLDLSMPDHVKILLP